MKRSYGQITKVFRSPFHYLRTAIEVVLRMRRPVRSLWHYLRLSRPGFTYVFRNGLAIATKFPQDVQTIFSIFFYRIYGRVGSHQTIIDIGSNIGVFALYAAHGSKNTVYAFEPSPLNLALLKENVRNNSLAGEIIVSNKGIASERGVLRMAADLGANSRVYRRGEEPGAGTETVDVKCVTLEDVFLANDIRTCDLMKIDCEGSEYDILYATPDHLFDRISEIRMEVDDLDNNRNMEAMQEFLESKGYVITHVRETILFARRAEATPRPSSQQGQSGS